MTVKQFNHIEKLVEKLKFPQSQSANITIQILKECKLHKTDPLSAYIDKNGCLVLAD